VSRRWANVVTVAALAVLCALVSLTAPRWARLLRQPLASLAQPGDEAGAAEAPSAPQPGTSPDAERRINVKLFFEDPERDVLVLEEREVPFSNELAGQIRAVLEELVKGSQAGHRSPLPPETRVIEVFVTARGIAYVDLSQEAVAEQVGGSKGELLAVYAIVNSITTNFPAVARVQILLDDRPATTLAGHVDLSRPLPPDMTLLAAAGIVAPGGSGGEGAPPAAPAAAPSPLS
jgi:hypothetical protein